MLLETHVERLTTSLQQRWGRMVASEAEKRRMVAEKRHGLVPGARSLYRVEKKLEAKGRLERKQLWPGQRHPGTGVLLNKRIVATRLISRQESRALARKKRKTSSSAKRAPPKISSPNPGKAVLAPTQVIRSNPSTSISEGTTSWSAAIREKVARDTERLQVQFAEWALSDALKKET